MILQRIETIDEFSALRSEWNDLLRTSRSDCVFLTHEWLFTWWKHLSDGRRLSISVVRASPGGRLLAIAPMVIRRAQYSRMTPRLIQFLGSGVIGSDYLDLIIGSGYERDAMNLFASDFANRNLMIEFGQVRQKNSFAGEFGRLLEQEGWAKVDTTVNICPFINIDSQKWEAFLASLSSNHRYNFQRRLKNLKKEFAVEFAAACSSDEAERALETLIVLHRKRWTQRGEASDAFQNDAVVAFHREFARLALGHGWLRLFTLTLNGEAAASLYGLMYGRKFHFYQSGFDVAYGKHSVGLVTMGLAIKAAIDAGAIEYDLLHGGEDYKFQWTNEFRELCRLELFPPRPEAQVFRHAIHLNRAARTLARRVLCRS
jgi:CelD/BcsL family acetyltransferase involved in cellulose biosynthesis